MSTARAGWLSVTLTVWLASGCGDSARADSAPGARRVTLTAVSRDAVWTLQPFAIGNYWRSERGAEAGSHGERQYTPATIVARRGEKLTLVLKSVDNPHGFYVPALGIGPYEIGPGETKEVVIDTATIEPGAYLYLCTKERCSDRHHWMRGDFIVYPESGSFAKPPDLVQWNAPGLVASLGAIAEVPAGPSVARGQGLFQTKGCITCHNTGGQGGIVNYNYEPGTVPKLNNRAEILQIDEPEAATKVIEILARGDSLTAERLAGVELPRPAVTLALYENMRTLVRNGRPDEGKKDPHGPAPPLAMPSWRQDLSDADINNILAYLVSVSPIEDAETQPKPPPPLPVLAAPASYDAALAAFGAPDIRVRYDLGDRLVLALLGCDAALIAPALCVWWRRRTPKPKEKAGGRDERGPKGGARTESPEPAAAAAVDKAATALLALLDRHEWPEGTSAAARLAPIERFLEVVEAHRRTKDMDPKDRAYRPAVELNRLILECRGRRHNDDPAQANAALKAGRAAAALMLDRDAAAAAATRRALLERMRSGGKTGTWS